MYCLFFKNKINSKIQSYQTLFFVKWRFFSISHFKVQKLLPYATNTQALQQKLEKTKKSTINRIDSMSSTFPSKKTSQIFFRFFAKATFTFKMAIYTIFCCGTSIHTSSSSTNCKVSQEEYVVCVCV
jgi:hypothetical protein